MSTIRGTLSTLKRQPGGTIRFNTDASATANEVFIGLYANSLQQAPKRYVTRHPIFTNLVCNEVEIKEVGSGVCQISVQYFGQATGLTDGGPDLTPTWDLSCESAEQPIETYPSFSSSIGTSGNGAKFDSNGIFLGFQASSAFAGQTSWLVPGQIWRKQGYSLSAPAASDLGRIGKIDTPDGWVATPSGRNWLLRSFNVQLKGNVYAYTKTWELSGPAGWNTTIYAPS